MADNSQVKAVAPAVESKDALVNALKQDFATSVQKVYINSLGREVAFREITVLEQKTLSRTMIDNNSKNRKDVVFEAQAALINNACLEPGFDIFELKEFDRLKLLIAIYQANMFKNDIHFKCEQCGAENVYKLDFDSVLKKLDAIDISDKETDYESKNFKYHFKIAYPSVKTVLNFYKSYNKKYRGANNNESKSLDNMSNMDYINLYISEIDVENKATKMKKHINMADYQVGDIEDIMAIFPQDVLYTENGVLYFIINNFIKVINDTFEVQHCYNCNAVYENTVNSA